MAIAFLLRARLLIRESSTLTAPGRGFVCARSGAFRRRGWTGATTVAAVAAIICLAAGSPASGAGPRDAGTPHPRVTQAPALPGAQPISGNDRVYTADQDSNTVTVINPKTDTVLGTIPMGAVRLNTNADTLGAMYNGEIDVHGLGFSRDGRYVDVMDVTTNAVQVIDTPTNKVIRTIYVGRPPHEGFFSPNGRTIWVAAPGRDSVTVSKFTSASLTVGNLNETLAFRRSAHGGAPVLVKRIHDHGDGPHGVWPSPDNTRIYVALQYSDGVDVINTKTMNVIKTLHIGQSPMALVYVARSSPGSTAGLSHQGLGMRHEYLPATVQGATGRATVQARALPGLDEVVLVGWNLPASTPFTLYAARGNSTTALMSTTTTAGGDIPEAFAYTDIFANHYNRFILRRSP